MSVVNHVEIRLWNVRGKYLSVYQGNKCVAFPESREWNVCGGAVF